jgi:hypothetical protein
LSEKLLAQLDDITLGSSFAGITILRDLLLPDLLGKESDTILYWAGKQLAQKMPLPDFTGIQNFFVLVSFGDLSLLKQKGTQYEFELSGEPISQRLAVDPKADFQLETGFIAQQLQQQLGFIAEGISSPEKHTAQIKITIQTDPKDVIAPD